MTKQEREQKMVARLAEMKQYENALREQGVQYIAGMDEVGRGPLAGPVVAACVVLPADFSVLGVDDSKKLSEKRRETLYDQILEHALAWGIGEKDNHIIDEINILEATKLAMLEAVANCESMLRERTGASVEHVLIDALSLDDLLKPQTAIIKGDAASVSIAAASIVAKVTRDRQMIAYADEFPGYAFEKNKGYGTKAHYEGIRAQGITRIHRVSFLKNL